jgi:hypothetical protein
MSIGSFLGGMGRTYAGIQAGGDAELARQQLAIDNTAKNDATTYAAGQRSRVLAEQGREDTARTESQNIPKTVQVDANAGITPLTAVDDEGNASPAIAPNMVSAPMSDAETLRRQADILQKQGKTVDAVAMRTAAMHTGMAAAAQSFQQIASLPPTTSALSVAQQAAKIFNNDPLPGNIEKILPTASGGVSIDFVNKTTGSRVTKEFANGAEVQKALQAYYDPATYGALIKANADAERAKQAKIDEEQAKTIILPPGSTALQGGKQVGTNDNGLMHSGQFRADGSEIMVPTKGRVGQSGAGARDTTKISQGIALAMKDDSANIGEAVSKAAALAENNPDMSDELAQALGIRMARNGGKGVSVTINPKTGMLDQHYEDANQVDAKGNVTATGSGKRFLLGSSEYRDGSPLTTPEQMKTAVTQMTASMAPAERQLYTGALTPDGRTAFMTNAQAQLQKIQAAASDEIAKNPKNQPAIVAKVAELQDQIHGSVRKLDLLAKFSPLTAAANGQASSRGATRPAGVSADAAAAASRYAIEHGYEEAPGPGGAAPAVGQVKPTAPADPKVAEQKKYPQSALEALSWALNDDAKTMEPKAFVEKYNGQIANLSPPDVATLTHMKSLIH